jgi:hypothetical protein
MPTNDMDVQAALASFGAVSKKNCKDATVAAVSRSSRRSGAAPPRPHTAGRGADFCPTTQRREISPLHRPGAVHTQIVVRARAVHPEYDHIADATVTSAAVRRPPERPARRRRFATGGRSCTSTGSAPCSCGLSSVHGLCALIAGGVRPSAGPTPCLRGLSSGQGQCAPNTTTSPTRLSPPPPCAGRRSGRPGEAASRPDRRSRALSRWPGAVHTQIVVRAGAVRPEYDHIVDATVTSAAVRRPPERPARRRRFAPGGDLVPPPAQRRAPAGCPTYKGCAS